MSDTNQIEVDTSTFERFEEARMDTKNAHVPEMEPSIFLDALLDTQEAVQEGYYDD